MKLKTPEFEALDDIGLPFKRLAKSIGELPQDQVGAALMDATSKIAAEVGRESSGCIKFGAPVFLAFKGMNRATAKQHRLAGVLLQNGATVSLDWCPSYA